MDRSSSCDNLVSSWGTYKFICSTIGCPTAVSSGLDIKVDAVDRVLVSTGLKSADSTCCGQRHMTLEKPKLATPASLKTLMIIF